ncbi:hypothetical protein [Streptomyces sp. NPDC059009]|uniref:hypothetical protein n=1 Tax=Streptomyces sp. NPDC059009 TaxID=3346694 RepID=UPI0036870464
MFTPQTTSRAQDPHTQRTKMLLRQKNGDLTGIRELEPRHDAVELKEEITKAKCFEAGVSLAILDNPGQVGRAFDKKAEPLKGVLEAVYRSPLGEQTVHFQGKPRSLREVFDSTLLDPLSPTSDQIGRWPAPQKADQFKQQADKSFLRTEVLDWVLTELGRPSVTGSDAVNAPGYRYSDLLTKVRAVSAFGTTMWQLLSDKDTARENLPRVAELLSAVNSRVGTVDSLRKRFGEFQRRTRNHTFDNPLLRARRERIPELPDHQELKGWTYESAALYGLGFGQVIQPGGVQDEGSRAALEKALVESGGVNGIRRQGAPIGDPGRLMVLSDDEFAEMPDAFKKCGLQQSLKEHRFDHGTGVNRWEPYGVFAAESADQGFPSAGAQSGGTCDILLAAGLLSADSLYGRRETVLPLTLGIVAFMNSGAYHTAVEIFRNGRAMARGVPAYVPHVDRRHRGLYDDIMAALREFGARAAYDRAAAYKRAFDAASSKSSVRPDDVTTYFHLSDRQQRDLDFWATGA